MVLDVKRIINTPGGRIGFDFAADYSDVDFGGVCPAVAPVLVVGEVCNIAGMLQLRMKLDVFDEPFALEVSYLLAEELENDENDDILLLEEGKLNLEELSREVFILNMPSKMLCSEDCKGLCSGCGANLNRESCRCKKEIDPRMAKLASLLKNE